MVTVNTNNYLERRTGKGSHCTWWIVRKQDRGFNYIDMNKICLPNSLEGKRIRFKMEVIDEPNPKTVDNL